MKAPSHFTKLEWKTLDIWKLASVYRVRVCPALYIADISYLVSKVLRERN